MKTPDIQIVKETGNIDQEDFMKFLEKNGLSVGVISREEYEKIPVDKTINVYGESQLKDMHIDVKA